MAELVRFQHYEVLRRDDGSLFELGRGAMGITYKAFDTNLRTNVALKVINATYLNSEVARQRFLREARAAAAIRHPNVATVFHLGNEDDSYFYAMEFIDGETVEAFMQREGAVPTIMALEISAQVARALAAAEKQGLVHRDIKPSNLMLVREAGDDEFTVKVIDFGLAKAAEKDSADAVTLTQGGFLGTPHFASPEQLEEGELDSRSDIYSLGVTLYYMLAGRTPLQRFARPGDEPAPAPRAAARAAFGSAPAGHHAARAHDGERSRRPPPSRPPTCGGRSKPASTPCPTRTPALGAARLPKPRMRRRSRTRRASPARSSLRPA